MTTAGESENLHIIGFGMELRKLTSGKEHENESFIFSAQGGSQFWIQEGKLYCIFKGLNPQGEGPW